MGVREASERTTETKTRARRASQGPGRALARPRGPPGSATAGLGTALQSSLSSGLCWSDPSWAGLPGAASHLCPDSRKPLYSLYLYYLVHLLVSLYMKMSSLPTSCSQMSPQSPVHSRQVTLCKPFLPLSLSFPPAVSFQPPPQPCKGNFAVPALITQMGTRRLREETKISGSLVHSESLSLRSGLPAPGRGLLPSLRQPINGGGRNLISEPKGAC